MLYLEDIIGAVILLSSILFGLFFIYRNEGLHKNLALHMYLKQAAAIFSILFSSAVVLQVFSYNRDQKVQTVQQFNLLAKEFFVDTLRLFVENPKMDYYFEHLYNRQPIEPGTVRDLAREREIAYIIFNHLGTVVSYLDVLDENSGTMLENWIAQVVTNFIKSPIFVGYWQDYKKYFGANLSEKFMKKYYNL
jgi:hypothetical protein